MLELLMHSYYWPGMKRDVQRMVATSPTYRTTPTNSPIKSYKVGLKTMHTIFSFGILSISLQSFKCTKCEIAVKI